MEARHVLAAALVLGGGAAAVWALRQQRRGDSAPQPAAALELSFALDVLEISDAGEGPVVVQFLMQ